MTNGLGAVTDSYSYDAFGNLIVSAGGSNNAYLFAGEQRDSETGLDYLRARYYDPLVGRFVSADAYEGTLNDPMSLHDYQYAHANPVVNTDPSGYFSVAEMHVAESIRNILAGIQIDTGIYLISATHNYAQGKGDYKIGDFLLDLSWNSFFALAPMLAPYLVSGVRGMIRRLKNANHTSLAGTGGAWKGINEIRDPSVIQQLTTNACGPACAQMILRDLGVNVFQSQVAAEMGTVLSHPEILAMALTRLDNPGSLWRGVGVTEESINGLNNTGSWIAMMKGSRVNHWIIVDGFDGSKKNLLIRDPWEGTKYTISFKNFLKYWTQYAVFKAQ
ncbi:MAG: RHS repeat-associated core domain-containing protein [Microcoleus sp.]